MAKPELTRRNEVFNQSVRSDVVNGRYDLSARSCGSFRMGVLYPVYCRNDIVPGDKFEISAAPFVRFLPLVSPSLTDVDVELRYFFVPYRMLWSQWKNFISPTTAEDAQLIEPFLPNRETLSANECIYNVAGSLYDYMGCSCIPWSRVGGTNGVYGSQRNAENLSQWYENMVGEFCPVKQMPGTFEQYLKEHNNVPIAYSAYPFLAYNSIWNEYFRDENLQSEALSHVTTPGAQHGYDFYLRRVNWEKDYFSSALPFVTQNVFATPAVSDGMSIEQLREESALTKWLELQAVGGHRYQESILTHFGVRVPDEAAQIPVYLGGGKCPVQIGSVDQTSPFNDGTDSSPLATIGGKGTAGGNMFVDKCEFKEHGVVLGMMYIRPKALYADVTPKDLFHKNDRHDYLWPSFVNLGDEAVKSNELNPGYFAFSGGDHDHGYQMRYASYRTSFDQVHGQLRPIETLESWTQARSWANDIDPNGYEDADVPVQISDDFITCRPSNRIFAVTEESDNLVGEILTFVDAVRPAPSYVDPKID